MCRAMLIVLAVAFSSLASNAADDEIQGTYRLISTSPTIVATGEIQEFRNERGYIVYGRDGHMMVLILRGNRPKAESEEKMTGEQKARLFDLMTAYAGTYKFDGKTVEHHIELAWNEIWAGRTLYRNIKKDGKRVTLTTHPTPGARDGKVGVTTLVWEKID